MFCPKCGAELKEGDKFCSSCGAVIEYIRETDSRITKSGMEKAGAGARLISYFVDSIIVNVISVSAVFISLWFGYGTMVSLYILFSLIFPAGYLIYFFANGQTPGMMAMKIKLWYLFRFLKLFFFDKIAVCGDYLSSE
ncbi:MAG: zinc-ribbon domain-containing protein [Candidatus Methanospirareceae archaeon]